MTRRDMLGILSLSFVPWHVNAQQTQGRRIVGDVVIVRPTRLHIKSIGDRTYTVTLNKATRIRRGDDEIPVEEIRVGERVVIDVGTGTEPLVAREVILAAAARSR